MLVDTIKNLIESPIGEKLKVIKVNAGYHAKRRLAHLGIVPGVNLIKKCSAPFRGPIEINVKGSCLVIGRGLAAKILVQI
ncbi:MAG: ferrous iron transport protein A [Promethearchaeota archaeon]